MNRLYHSDIWSQLETRHPTNDISTELWTLDMGKHGVRGSMGSDLNGTYLIFWMPIYFYFHPSGVDEPSRADQTATDALKSALGLVDVRVLDHFIVAGADVLSFAERGLI